MKKYERPRLVELRSWTAEGQDCVSGGTAPTKCQGGNVTNYDCDNDGLSAVTKCDPTGGGFTG